MSTLVLQPSVTSLAYHLFVESTGEAILAGRIEDLSDESAIRALFDRTEPELVAVRVAFGATEFARPALASTEVVGRLEGLVSSAPLHLPGTIQLIRLCEALSPAGPVVLVFDTSFFAGLPDREATYGIDTSVAERIEVRRYGYHGIFHAEAVAAAAAQLGRNAARKRRADGRCALDKLKVLSICLEPQPEVVAALGESPLTVTGGTTPLEGLPGETTCGEIDPSIVLELAGKEGWGPEQIDYTLTHESGLSAIAGRRLTVGEALAVNELQIAPAGRELRYRILLAAGAGMAALDGLDAIVFSGRYRNAGEYLGPWLSAHLHFRGGTSREPLPWLYLDKGLPRLIADAAQGAVQSVVR